MDLQTFQAPTMSQCLAQVKVSMGVDAVILHTRTIRQRLWLGLRHREMVEITAGRGLNVRPRALRAGAGSISAGAAGPAAYQRLDLPGRQDPGSRDLTPRELATRELQSRDALTRDMQSRLGRSRDDVSGGNFRDGSIRSSQSSDLANRRSAVLAAAGSTLAPGLVASSAGVASAGAMSKLASAGVPATALANGRAGEPGRALLETPAAQTAIVMGFTQEINSLKSMVQQLVNETRHRQCPQVPEELFEFYMQMIENQVAVELATEVVKTLQKQMRPEHMSSKEFVREKLAEQLEKMLPSAGPINRTKLTGPHVVALIGPTGVGKTTTVAKLAANLKLREKHRVGLITIDTYRIAAIDQLKKYADIIGAPLKVVGTSEDMEAAIRSMSDCDYILIDTAGRSPTDTLKLNELKTFLDAANPDEVHLVLSTTASQACVELAVSRFGDVRVDKIIFTKLDEAAHVGVVLNVMRKVNKSLSYVTTGQDVPNDIEVGRGRKLAQLILGGGR
jgi:flagellar biosynthesis protein FlhF